MKEEKNKYGVRVGSRFVDLSFLEKVFETPHLPTLVPLNDSQGKLYRSKFDEGVFKITKGLVIAKKVGDFCYTEEEILFPIKEVCKKLGDDLTIPELDTKILRAMYPKLNFNAYSFDPIGFGFNIDGLSRVSGGLYKIRK